METNVDVEREEQRARLTAGAGTPLPGGEFEILAITAGEGNGWQFGEEALRASLALWEGVETFVDHGGGGAGRSLRDLAGVCHAPRYDEQRRGVLLRLKPGGPAAALLEELGREWLAGAGPRPRVGFSADLLFKATGRQVKRILKVFSLDVVVNPARGGAFVRLLNGHAGPGIGKGTEKEESMTEMQGQENEVQERAEGSVSQVQLQLCGCLLDATLAAAGLPAPMTERIRRQFSGRIFEQTELQAAVDDGRGLASELGGAAAIRGAGAISAVYDPLDQVTAALNDLLGAGRPRELEGLKTARLSGIREFYTLMTGDGEFTGVADPQRARLAATGDLPGVLKNALNKLIVAQWQELGRAGYRWWEPVVSVEHFSSLHDITGVLVGEVNVLPAIAEGDAYGELAVSDSAETGSWGKYGGYIGLALEMFERDETHKLRQYPRKLASAALRRISALVGAIFTGSSGTGPAMADGYHVFEAAHHANLGTAALSGESWEAASQAIYGQNLLVASGGTSPKLALDAKYLLVPRDLRLTGMRILYPSFEREATIFSENMQRGEQGDVITVPEFGDASDWAAVADPRLAPGIILGERFGLMPEIFLADSPTGGALFTNDELRMKVRHWVSVFVADHRPLYKANVA
jgi:hypothetical protein